jgi:hypothetical protein
MKQAKRIEWKPIFKPFSPESLIARAHDRIGRKLVGTISEISGTVYAEVRAPGPDDEGMVGLFFQAFPASPGSRAEAIEKAKRAVERAIRTF